MKQQKDILYILIPSFVLLVLWIAFTIYSNAVSSTITQTQQVNIQPIAPSFDTATIGELKERKKVTPQDEAIIIVEEDDLSVSPTPSISVTESTQSAEEEIISEEEL